MELAIPRSPPTAASDESLIARFSAGDDTAFATLYDRYRAPVIGYAARMLGRREEAEEVCTDTFCRLVEGKWRPTGTIKSYVFTVAHRLCIDRIRRRGSWSRAALRLVGLADAPRSAEGVLLAGEQRSGLEAAIGQLSDEHRAAVLLYYTEELSSREVAGVLGCSDQQVRSRLSYARRRLRQLMIDEGAG